MTLMKRIVFIAILLSLFTGISNADQGTTSAVFLKLEQGVRPISMGGAFTAAADDVNAVLWNAAGLAQLSSAEVTFTHSMWFADIFFDYIAAAFPAGEIGAFGLGVVYVNSGEIPRWDEFGNPGVAFSAWNLGISLGYGTQINKEMSLGITVKVFNESIDDVGAFGFAADIGGIYRVNKDFAIGLVLQNLGPKHGFGEAFLLPIAAKLGISYTGVRNMMLNIDYTQPIETFGILAMGLEYWYRNMVVLRLGYQFQGMFDLNKYYENFAGPAILAGFVMGAGLKIDIYEIDYAYRQYGVLESTHRIGLTLKFK